MLSIFRQEFVHPPEELNSPASSNKLKNPDQILEEFLSSDPHNAFSTMFGNGAALAYIRSPTRLPYARMYGAVDDVHCLFLGRLDNLSSLLRQYGLSKTTNE